MRFSDYFVSKGKEFNSIEKNVSAPYLRQTFDYNGGKAEITVGTSGFYRLYVNGKDVTRGILAPYINNPDDVTYYDSYDITELMKSGKNAVGLVGGNGFGNALDGGVWDFEKSEYRSAPRLAFSVEIDGNEFATAEGARVHDSPWLFDDIRFGEKYDKSLEIPDFSTPEYDDKEWTIAERAPSPKGEKRLHTAPPIAFYDEYQAEITPYGEGYIYKFPINSAGVTRLRLKKPTKGQTVTYIHTEITKNGKPSTRNIIFFGRTKGDPQKVVYVARGDEEEIFQPVFSYYGCQYVYIEGVRADQADKSLLTFVTAHSAFRDISSFLCSDKMANDIERVAINSDKSNLFYFPTDCPHREKNGWTGDASASAEHFLLNYNVEDHLSEWLFNIRKAQREDGALPGIIPTSGWGFRWGNGPMWDSVLAWTTCQIYRFTGDKKILLDNENAIYRYLKYAETKLDGNGLAHYGLGDWLQASLPAFAYYCPLAVSDSIILISIAKCAVLIYDRLEMKERKAYAEDFLAKLRGNVRAHLIDFKKMLVKGKCQTAQAIALFFGVFDEAEEQAAFAQLLRLIKKDGNHLNSGLIGIRVIFHVLCKYGETDLAYKMITQESFPSYGYLMKNGATSLWEDMKRVYFTEKGDIYTTNKPQSIRQVPSIHHGLFNLSLTMHSFIDEKIVGHKPGVNSRNHHFFGDVSSWFKRCVAGVCVNDGYDDIHRIDIKPHFVNALTFAQCEREFSFGKLFVRWEREKGGITLTVNVPEEAVGTIALPKGFTFDDGTAERPLASGTYSVAVK